MVVNFYTGMKMSTEQQVISIVLLVYLTLMIGGFIFLFRKIEQNKHISDIKLGNLDHKLDLQNDVNNNVAQIQLDTSRAIDHIQKTQKRQVTQRHEPNRNQNETKRNRNQVRSRQR